jgi:hypothetical protein
LSAAIQKLFKQDKYAKYLDEAAAETAVAAKAEKGATKVVAASSESSAAKAESSAAAEAKAAVESASGKAKATVATASEKTKAVIEKAKSDVAPASVPAERVAAESSAPAEAFKPASFAPKNVVQFAENPELKNFFTQAGLKESEAKPALAAVAKVASGGELATFEERAPLMQAMLAMKPERRNLFEAKAIDLLQGNKSEAARLQAQFKHAERVVEAHVDPTIYPELQKIPLKKDELLAIEDISVAAEENGHTRAQVRNAQKDAIKACPMEAK